MTHILIHSLTRQSLENQLIFLNRQLFLLAMSSNHGLCFVCLNHLTIDRSSVFNNLLIQIFLAKK